MNFYFSVVVTKCKVTTKKMQGSGSFENIQRVIEYILGDGSSGTSWSGRLHLSQ